MGTGMVMQEAESAYVDRPQMSKKSKMTFKQRIRNWLRDDDNSHSDMLVSSKQAGLGRNTIGMEPPREFDADGLTVTIHNANGGYVASFRRYDRKTDRHGNQLYVITSDQKFEEALAQCIAMECLSR